MTIDCDAAAAEPGPRSARSIWLSARSATTYTCGVAAAVAGRSEVALSFAVAASTAVLRL